MTGLQWSKVDYKHLPLRTVLASVIQGEARTPDGQFAVCCVMLNRLEAGRFGASLQTVVQPNQFNGWQTPTKQAYGFADVLIGNLLRQYGSTGNALYYAAPSTKNAAWANPNTESGAELFRRGADIGGNYFTDDMGPPTVNFVAPKWSGSVPHPVQSDIASIDASVKASNTKLADALKNAPPPKPVTSAQSQSPKPAPTKETNVNPISALMSFFSIAKTFAPLVPHIVADVPTFVADAEKIITDLGKLDLNASFADAQKIISDVQTAAPDFASVVSASKGLVAA